MRKFKKGAASFYIVAFSTLILMIVAMSFAAVIISEVTRTSNDDLSQSAYDSALAGVEDAKLAFYNYQSCKSQNPVPVAVAPNNDNELTCSEIIWYVEQSDDCDMVAKILGRNIDEETGVSIEESKVGNNMAQSYTCVKIADSLSDYRSTLSASNTMKVMRAKFDNVKAKDIKKVRISWYSDVDQNMSFSNFNESGGKVEFPRLIGSKAAVPPTIYLAGLQTDGTFTLSDFDVSRGNSATDRWMAYMVPTNSAAAAGQSGRKDTYIPVYSDGKNQISASALVKSNDKTKENLPFLVYCNPGDGEFACSAELTLPATVRGDRNDDTFVFVAGLPYGSPTTDFSLEFFCADGNACGGVSSEGSEGGVATNQARLKGVQVQVDSTGRANDLFRRVETRLENTNDFALSLMGPLELFGEADDGSGGNAALKKDLAVTCEYDFEPTCAR